MSTEEWRAIPGYADAYKVSNLGRIKSLSRSVRGTNGCKRIVRERILKERITSRGYIQYALSDGDKTRYILGHRLVAEAFISRFDSSLEVNHINHDRADNRAENLEMVTHSENQIHKVLHNRGGRSQLLTSQSVSKIKEMIQAGFKNAELSRIFKVSPTAISNIRTGKRWSHINVGC